MNNFGKLLTLTSFGESHGPAMGGVLDGMPAGVAIDLEKCDFRTLNVTNTINSDDCAIFDTAYITDDLLLAYLCWDLSFADIKRCLKNSLCGDQAREEIFEASWAEFESSL